MRTRMRDFAWVPAILVMAACGSRAPEPPAARPVPLGATCDRDSGSAEPDLFGWDPGSRAKLATLAVDGIVVVHYERNGCDIMLDVLPRCTSRKAYYTYDRRPERETRTARDEREMLARFPIAVGRLRANLQQGMELRVDYAQTGVEHVPDGTRIESEDLIGDCDGATHVVSSIARGAFVLASGEHQALEGSVSLWRASAESRVRVMDQAGEIAACDNAQGDLVAGCDVPLRVTLTELGGVAGTEPLQVAGCPSGMAAIPGGKFKMGCHEGQGNEKPVHDVALSPYCLGVTEVTVGEYAACVRAGRCTPIGEADERSFRCTPRGPSTPNFPQSCVSREQAANYCSWTGGRLPTEAEWEYAARFGSEEWPYPIGLLYPTVIEACIRRYEPCQVRSYRPEAFGLHDMTGNLREWVADDYVDYSLHARTNPRGGSVGITAVVRGGAYTDDYRGLRSTLRHQDSSGPAPMIGFRCARNR
jgi:sulfatase modifying factor 1